jgi:DNA-binding NtrC family response regulator
MPEQTDHGVREPEPFDGSQTLPLKGARTPTLSSVRRFRLTVIEGVTAGRSWESTADRCSIGSHELNDLRLDDPTVSRFHCEITMGVDGARALDLHSMNGTVVDGVQIAEAWLRSGSLLRIGRVTVRFDFEAAQNHFAASEKSELCGLVGGSVAMRTVYTLIERAAASDATVLLEGETGTGKGQAAEAIHKLSARRNGPLVVVDCGAIPGNLLESELFGHEKGAFTGAESRRIGAFEEAAGGTIFLDEVGELPADLQPKLLRVIENREIRRLGTNQYRPVDFRLVAATHRDLRADVNGGRFRADLFFRLAVVRITMPALRQRPDDLPAIARRMLAGLGASEAQLALLTASDFLVSLQDLAWPGNARELRNHLERCLVFEAALTPSDGAPEHAGAQVDADRSYADERRRAIDRFERAYALALLERHQGKVAQAAQAAGIDRVYLYRLMRRHGIKSS